MRYQTQRKSSRRQKLVSQRKINRCYFLFALYGIVTALVLLLDVCFVVFPDRESSSTENRNLQQFPKVTLHTLTSGSFENDFEKYIADQFPFRDLWIRLETTALRMTGRTESNGIFLAKNGYLIQDFNEPTENGYAAIVKAMKDIAALSDTAKARAMILPTAVLTYKNKLPACTVRGDQGAFLDQLNTDLTASGISFIDVRNDFASSEEQLYYRTDHHWTTAAAHLAYQAYKTAAGISDSTAYTPLLVSDSFKGTLTASSGFRTTETDEMYIYQPDNAVGYTVTYVSENEKSASVFAGANLETRDQYALFFNGNHPLVEIDTAIQNDRILLVLKDSYANCFLPFLIPDYNRIIIVDPRYYTDDFRTLVETEDITDILFLYNASSLATDTSLSQLLDE